MKKIIILMCLLLLTMTACLAGPNDIQGVPDTEGEVAGFWMGLWHGLIIIISLIVSLFSDSYEIYEIHNNGGWYNVGFLFGLLIALGGSAGGGSSYRAKRK